MAITIIRLSGRVIRHSRKYVIVISPGKSRELKRLFKALVHNGHVMVEVNGIQMSVHAGALGNRLVLYLPRELDPIWERVHGESVDVSILA